MADSPVGSTPPFRTVNPATGEVGTTRDAVSDARLAQRVNATADAQREWAKLPLEERCAVNHRIAGLHRERRDHLADLIVTEVGKPRAQALGEVDLTADIYQYYADNGPNLLRDRPLPLLPADGQAVVRQSPLGALLGIMPWNFPYYQIARFAAPNLVAGNAVLLKPAPQCPDSATATEQLLRQAGLPEAVYTTLWARHEQIESVIAHPGVRGVSFTGSGQSGTVVAELAGRHRKKVVLELGGSDPFLVLDVRDMAHVVRAAVAARLENNGQACNGAKRFVVLTDRYDDFVAGFVAAMSRVTIGDPREPGTELGPVSSVDGAQRLAQQVADAVADGATLRLGGSRTGAFIEPTVLTDIAPGNRAHHQEFFGPVALVYRAADETDAVRIANDTPYGLGSYVFTDDPAQAARVVDQIEAGMVYVNGVGLESPELPFGGIKDSGFGRELGPQGIGEFVNLKLIRTAGPATAT